MKVDGRHEAWLRAVVTGQQEDALHLGGKIFAAGTSDALYPFLYCAFAVGIRKFFGDSYSHSEVIALVAAVRAELSGTPADGIDPVAAESGILRALGDTAASVNADADARAVAETALLSYTVRAMELDAAQVDDLLSQAARMLTDSSV